MAETLAPLPLALLEETADWISRNLRPVSSVMADTEASEISPAAPPELELRDYQIESWASIWRARREGCSEGHDRISTLLELATGLGKTTVVVGDFKKFCEEREQEGLSPPRGLFVSHRHAINKQAEERFQLFMDELELGASTDPEDMSGDSPTPRLDLLTIQTLYKRLAALDPGLYDYIAWDEAHHTMAETYAQVVRHLRPAFELAVTATPDRLDGKEITDHFGEAVYRKVLAEAIAERHLAQVDYHMVFDSTIQTALQEGASIETLKDLRELFETKPPLEAIARDIQEERHKLGLGTAKTLVFCEDVKEADELAALLGCEAYHSLQGIGEQDRIMEEYKANPNGVLCTVDKFNEGVDVPDIRLVVFNRATESDMIFKQQLGRGLRLYAGKERVTVLDFVANIKRVALVRDLSEAVRRNLRTLAGQDGTGSELKRLDQEGWAKDDKGIAVHAGDSTFAFSRLVVDVLEAFDRLSDDSFLSTDKLSLSAASKELQMSLKKLEEKIAEMGWELPNHRFGPRTVPSITRLQIAELQATFPDTFAPVAPKGYYSIRSASIELGIHYYLVKRLVEELTLEYEWELPRYRFGGLAADAINTDQFELLKQHPEVTIPRADDSIIALYALGRQIKTTEGTLRDWAEKAKPPVPVNSYKFKGKPGSGIRREDIPALLAVRNALAPLPPPGYLSQGGFATKHNITPQTVKRIVAKLGWKLPEYAFGKVAGGLSPEQQEELLAHPRVQAAITRRNHGWSQSKISTSKNKKPT